MAINCAICEIDIGVISPICCNPSDHEHYPDETICLNCFYEHNSRLPTNEEQDFIEINHQPNHIMPKFTISTHLSKEAIELAIEHYEDACVGSSVIKEIEPSGSNPIASTPSTPVPPNQPNKDPETFMIELTREQCDWLYNHLLGFSRTSCNPIDSEKARIIAILID